MIRAWRTLGLFGEARVLAGFAHHGDRSSGHPCQWAMRPPSRLPPHSTDMTRLIGFVTGPCLAPMDTALRNSRKG